MINRFSITTGRPSNRIPGVLISIALLIIAASAPLVAHGGFDHVRGTVVKVANNVLTVRTAQGNVDVKLDSQTDLTRNDQKAQLADLKPGTRVIVDVPEGSPEGSKDRTAHSIKIGAPRKAVAQHSEGSRK
jgi:hypothetical protein